VSGLKVTWLRVSVDRVQPAGTRGVPRNRAGTDPLQVSVSRVQPAGCCTHGGIRNRESENEAGQVGVAELSGCSRVRFERRRQGRPRACTHGNAQGRQRMHEQRCTGRSAHACTRVCRVGWLHAPLKSPTLHAVACTTMPSMTSPSDATAWSPQSVRCTVLQLHTQPGMHAQTHTHPGQGRSARCVCMHL